MISKYNESRREKRILMDDYDIPMTEELESEVLTVCNLSEGVEKRGEQRSTLRHIQNLMGYVETNCGTGYECFEDSCV